MAIPDEDVAQVRAATDIVALIGEHTALKRVGRRYVGLCPFHGEKSASFSVNVEEGLYYCFGCQASGDAISFVRAIEGCDFVEAVERLAARAGVTIHNEEDPHAGKSARTANSSSKRSARQADFYHERLVDRSRRWPPLATTCARGATTERSCASSASATRQPATANSRSAALASEEVLESAGLVYEKQRGQPRDAFPDRIIFPIFDSAGKAIALGGRYLPEELRKVQSRSRSEVPQLPRIADLSKAPHPLRTQLGEDRHLPHR